MSVLIPFDRISMFPARPRGFRAVRVQKPPKKCQKSPKSFRFSMFFVCRVFKTTWSRRKPLKSIRGVQPGHFGTLFNLVALPIVEMYSVLLGFFLAILNSQCPLAIIFKYVE